MLIFRGGGVDPVTPPPLKYGRGLDGRLSQQCFTFTLRQGNWK